MRVSIITTSYNSEKTIEDTIKSVLSQSYENIEYIVVDGGSTDDTLEIINKYKDKITKIISEKDGGIYDAMNKGIKFATGDIVGILNSDDLYYDDKTIQTVVENMQNKGLLWGDMLYVQRNNPNKIIREFKSSSYNPGLFEQGWHPPHPTIFVKKSVYDTYGLFNTQFKISADYELMLRFLLKYEVTSVYIPKLLVKMRVGGKTSKNIFNITNILRYKWEDYKAWEMHRIKVNHFRIFFLKSLSKVF